MLSPCCQLCTCLTVPVAGRQRRGHRDGRPEGVGGCAATDGAAVAAVVVAPVTRGAAVVDGVVDGAAVGPAGAVRRQAAAARAVVGGKARPIDCLDPLTKAC